MSEPAPPFPTSLCHRCRFHRIVRTRRSAFVMCRAPGLPKYAPQPVETCAGYSPAGPGAADQGEVPP